MKNNVGHLGFPGLVGIAILVAIGLVVYGRFHFEQKVPPQDATMTRLNDLEKKSSEIQTKIDHMQEAVNQVRSKMPQAEPRKPQTKKRH